MDERGKESIWSCRGNIVDMFKLMEILLFLEFEQRFLMKLYN